MTTKAPEKKMGRPLSIEGGGTVIAATRLSVRQNQIVEKAAKKAGKEKSEWMREVLFEAAQNT